MRCRTLLMLALLSPLLLAGERKSPPPRDGSDLIGTRVPEFTFERWINTRDGKPSEDSKQPVLYRWWTDGCSFCEASLPAIESLRKKYEGKGLRVVAVYHPKPVRDVVDEKIRQSAADMGYGGAIAVDADWSELKRLWLDAGERPATSVTVLADRDGVIRYVHPGPAIFPSDDPDHAGENRSFQELDGMIGETLAPADKD